MARLIVCGVDDSDVARAAVRVARDLSERVGTRLVLVHVALASVPPGTSAAPLARSKLVERERRDAESLLAEQAVEIGGGSDIERRVLFGDPAQALLDLARSEGADLLVVGSRKRGALSSALLGSVSAKLAGAAPCPVVIVPPRAVRADGEGARGR